MSEIKSNIKIKNIDELQKLIDEASEVIDKIKNFKFEIDVT